MAAFQYAPNLFPQMKLVIDQTRRNTINQNHKSQTMFYLTGSNRTLLDKNVKESLAGRCHQFHLNGFSVREILRSFPDLALKDIFLRGGFPELYTRQNLKPRQFYNDYVTSFIEKDVALSSGVEKIAQFHSALGILAARTGQFINVTNIANQVGVEQKTIQFWIDILARNSIVESVATFSTNLSKRLVKMRKLYFCDTGICVRLQSHEDPELLWNSAQVGSLFETLVFNELTKTRDNYLLEWVIYTWRTKEQNEIDLILTTPKTTYLIEVKLCIHVSQSIHLDNEAKKVFKSNFRKIIVTAGGEMMRLDVETDRVPIQMLGDYLLKAEGVEV